MTDFQINSNAKRVYADNFGGALTSSRFVVTSGTQEFTTVDGIRWHLVGADPDTWDDIGFPTDYNTSGDFIFPAAGEYLIVAYARLLPVGAVGSGTALIVISLGFVGVNEEASAPLADVGPKMSVAGQHRFTASQLFSIDAHAFGNASDMRVNEASISITKIRST